jgi:uncharacterized membrane protein YdjX (TVP38/TMEM64 family)
LGGALFGIYVGFPLACLLTGIGASCCYLWSYWLGKDLLEYYIPDKMKILQEKVCQIDVYHLNSSVSAVLAQFL